MAGTWGIVIHILNVICFSMQFGKKKNKNIEMFTAPL